MTNPFKHYTEACQRSIILIKGLYLSNAYIKRHDIEISYGECPWENGYAERLIRTLKEEEVHLNAYEDIHEARGRIGHFITGV